MNRRALRPLYERFKDTKKEEYTINYLSLVRVLSVGVEFGELALLNSKPRAATIMANEDSLFAVLDKKGFDRNLKNSENNKLEREIKELNNFGIFRNLTRTSKCKVNHYLGI